MHFNKLYLSITLLLIGAIWVACVDIPTGPGTNVNPDIRSLVRFVNAADSVASGTIVVDDVPGPSINFLSASGYLDEASGTRHFSFAGAPSPAATVGLIAEQQSTVVVYKAKYGPTAFLNLAEGHMSKNNGVAGFAKVRFVNVATASADNLSFTTGSVTGENQSGSVAFATFRQYVQLTPDTMTFYVVSPATFIAQISSTTNADSGKVTATATSADGITYTVDIFCDNSKGFLTTAEFRDAAAGNAVVHTIDVSGQTVSFPEKTVSGANEVPPVTTTSTGTATFGLSRDEFTYSISVESDNTQGFYTGADFRQGVAGSNGPVISPIDVTGQQMSFDTTEVSGSNEVPAVVTAAGGFGTFTLSRDALEYSVTVHRDTTDTTFTAAHFHVGAVGVNGPVVKNITLDPWSAQDTTFTGTWSRSDPTQPLTDALIADIIAGNIYVNCHTTAHPGGAIRGQLHVQATTTNTFSGSWTPSSGLSAAMLDSLAQALVYVNFYTNAHPNGQIRAQVAPDARTENVFEAVWNDTTVVPNLLQHLNAGNIFFSFETAISGGNVQGTLTFDPSAGIPGVATLPSFNYEAGKMYTIIATGSGTNLQLTRFEDRRYGFSKPVAPPAKKGNQTSSASQK